MSLIGALNIGKSALATHQAAIQVTGNNISNAGNADYTRQTVGISPNRDQQIQPGIFMGTGLNLSNIQRQIDNALQGRLRGAMSDSASADTMQQWLGRVEAVFNELTDQDLSTQLSKFFNAWSNLANNPQDVGLRQVVIQTGTTVATWLTDMRNSLSSLQSDVDDRLEALTFDANGLAQQVADLNAQIIIAEGGSGGTANGLRDQRDAVLKQLSELMDIKTMEQDNGVINVYVGSEPLVVNTQNRGVGLRTEVVDGKLTSQVIFKANNGQMMVTSGQLGALSEVRNDHIGTVIDQVDNIAGNLIFELNKIYSNGQGLDGFTSVAATNAVDDTSAVLNSDEAGLKFKPGNGSFVIHTRDKQSGLVSSLLVEVDLDGLQGNDTTMDSLAAAIDALEGVAATVVGGKLTISTESPGTEISFSQDTSGILASLGINSFFTGTDARDIAVHSAIKEQPRLLAASRNGDGNDNQTARLIAAMETVAMKGLGGASLKETYQGMVNRIAVAAAGAKTEAEASRVVKETLTAQREALSGVSLDEEAVNLMRQQRAFQGAARLIAAVDELMRAVLQLV